jgi:hypothetical protein
VTAKDFRDRYPALSSTAQDALLGRLIPQVDSAIARFCGWPQTDAGICTLEEATYTMYPTPRSSQPRELPVGLPLVSITSAHISEVWTYDSASLVASGDLLLDTELRAVWLTPSHGGEWSEVPRANKLVVVAGYDATPDGSGYSTAPGDLVHIVCRVIRHLWDLDQAQGKLSMSAEGKSSQRIESELKRLIPELAADALAAFIRWSTRVY